MEKRKVANGVFWVELPESNLRILCGSPADAVKLLIGLPDQVRAPREYVFRGNYGLASEAEISVCGVPPETVREM
jgi:hypothetical protein